MTHAKLVKATVVVLTFAVLGNFLPMLSSPASAATTAGGAVGACTLACSTVQPAGATCNGTGSQYPFSSQMCLAADDSADKALTVQSAWGSGGHYSLLVNLFNKALRDATASIAQWILVTELGGSNSFTSPNVTGAGESDHGSWLLGQIAIVRSIGLYLIIPMLFLVVLESIIKGSMYFMLRAVFILMPIAVIGGVAFVALTQLFVNIADEMCTAIGHGLINSYGGSLKTTIGNLDPSGFGLYMWIWMFVFVLAAVAIFVELILRQIGVYLAVLFMPLAFATMVWPPASKYVRRLSELILGLIFSKVFIMGAFALGVAAFANVNSASPTANGTRSPQETAINAIMTGAIIMLTAAFSGSKFLAFTPAAVGAAEGYVMNRRNLAGRGNGTQAFMQRRQGAAARRNNAVQPTQEFNNPPPT